MKGDKIRVYIMFFTYLIIGYFAHNQEKLLILLNIAIMNILFVIAITLIEGQEQQKKIANDEYWKKQEDKVSELKKKCPDE